MGEGLNLHGDAPSRHDPYRYWLTGILVELGAFAAFSAVIIVTTILLVVIFGG